DNPTQGFRFFVINDSSINAFAVPGGVIVAHSGLISATQDEGELASVLAHEIAHVTQRHTARAVETSGQWSLPVVAAMIAAIVVGVAANNPDIGQAALAATMAGNIQMQINFTRAHEREADRVGMQILAQAGFDPRSMPAFFERLQASSRYQDGNLPELLRTHPVTTDRVAESRDRADQYPKQFFQDTPQYHLLRAKLLWLTDKNPQELVKKLQTMLKEGRYRDERATRYALALTLLANKQIDGVLPHIEWLEQHDSDRVSYRLLRAHLAFLQKDEAAIKRIYQQALQVYPNDQVLSLDYAEKLLQNNEAKLAKTLLLELTPLANPHYYRLLAQAHQLTGAKVEAHLALAESFYLNGQTALAVAQLKEARQQNNGDFYLAARIEARYEELQKELQEERAGAKP
ncbi:MAG: hypothetical protein BWK79_16140, partial [Beggiatoa sp. IS2]